MKKKVIIIPCCALFLVYFLVCFVSYSNMNRLKKEMEERNAVIAKVTTAFTDIKNESNFLTAFDSLMLSLSVKTIVYGGYSEGSYFLNEYSTYRRSFEKILINCNLLQTLLSAESNFLINESKDFYDNLLEYKNVMQIISETGKSIDYYNYNSKTDMIMSYKKDIKRLENRISISIPKIRLYSDQRFLLLKPFDFIFKVVVK